MRLVRQILRLSATDLANHLGCAHLSQLSREVALGRVQKPRRNDPVAELLAERGRAHEAAYLAHLRATPGLDVVTIEVPDGANGVDETLAAMRAGADVIYQAPLGNDRWYGRADFLLRIDTPSTLGRWSYEVTDAKLATETRAGTILQLCVYSELVGALQGTPPENAYVVAPHHRFKPERYRLADYGAYYRLVQRRLYAALGLPPVTAAAPGHVSAAAEQAADTALDGAVTYPEPAQHCDVCAWWTECNARRRADDHLCFVAGISRLQIKELRERLHVDTLERLGDLREVPKPKRGSREALVRVRDQAAIQLEARRRNERRFELLEPFEAEHGLARLPAPSAHDMFLDLEGDRLAADGGREYLFGYVSGSRYTPLWAKTPAEEKQAFETVVDRILETFRAHPEMHVYHFGAYEPTAFKRLSGRYATRETELDTILRAELFVDLHTVVKHALKASVESYSIKELEPFFGLEREQDLRAATASRRAIEWAIETREADDASLAPHVEAVERYNREDCVSAARLRDWLEELRAEVVAKHTLDWPRPELKSGDANEQIAETAEETQRVMAALLDGVPDDPDERSDEQQARWLMAHLLEWHRREDKAAWWEFYRLRDLPLEDYLEERSALASLEWVETVGGTARRPIERYAFPAQDHDVRAKDKACMPPEGDTLGDVVAVDIAGHTLDVQHSGKQAQTRPTHLFLRRNVPSGSKPAALLDIGRYIAANGVDSAGAYRAARDLLLRRPPRLARAALRAVSPDAAPQPDDEVRAACQRVFALDHGVLPIQGPPGTGKTFTGSHMILALLEAGKKVGVTAVSHEVIRNLLQAVCERAQERGLHDFKCLHKGAPKDGLSEAIHAIDDNERVAQLFRTSGYDLLGGTAWLWARPDMREAADVLFIDEAGQMSLADVLAVSGAAASLVLLGDPQQLEQPQQASHPPGTGASALEHILNGAKTITADRGLFLSETRRLHPDICEFTAEVFYEGRLKTYPGLERQAIVVRAQRAARADTNAESNARPQLGLFDAPPRGTGDRADTGGSGGSGGKAHPAARFGTAGLVYVPVEHDGNQARAEEEVTAVAEIVAALTADGTFFRDARGTESPLTLDDVMIVAPYNAQVTALAEKLPGARVGTVDKFQGQQAPVVIVSLTTSTPDDAPRGMDFLYSANRLNVATSRAKALCIVVGAPRLFEPDCRTPAQMRLANAFCRYLELARTVRLR